MCDQVEDMEGRTYGGTPRRGGDVDTTELLCILVGQILNM